MIDEVFDMRTGVSGHGLARANAFTGRGDGTTPAVILSPFIAAVIGKKG